MTHSEQFYPKKNRSQLRLALRKQRRALSPQQQNVAAQQLCKRFFKSPFLLRSEHIALYLANDGEMNPSLLIKRLWKLNKSVYLPVLHPLEQRFLWFIRYTRKTKLKKNQLGILEPCMRAPHQRLPAHALDLVLLPLVGFDPHGGRLGMGGGFYDRTFAFTLHRPHQTPMLVGLAHECQKVSQLPIESWDIPLKAILTDQALYHS